MVSSFPTSRSFHVSGSSSACVLKPEEARGRTLISWGLVFISRADAANSALPVQLPRPPLPAHILPLRLHFQVPPGVPGAPAGS